MLLIIYQIILWLLLSFFPIFVYANEMTHYPIPLSVLVDTSKQMTIEEVSQPTTVFKDTKAVGFSGGYTRNVHWFKIKLVPFKDSSALILSYYLQGLDDVRLYLPKEDGSFSEQRSGDKFSFNEREVAHRDLNFLVTMPYQEPITAYLRMQTTSSSVIAVTAWQPQAFEQKNHIEYLIIGVMFGILFVMLMINLSLWRWLYDLTFRYYFLYLFSAIIYLAVMNGLVAEFVINNNGNINNYLFSLSAVLTLFFATLFYKYKLNIIYKETPILYWLVTAYQWLLIICAISIFFDYFTEVMVWVNRSMLILSLLIFIRAFHVWRHHRVSGLIIIALLFGVLSLFASTLTLLGIIETQAVFVYGPQLGIIATMLTLQLLLVQRIRQLQDDQKTAELRANEAEKTHQLQEKFLAMLTHELKTPLSVIRLAVARNVTPSQKLKEHAISAINDISMIIDRCSDSEKMTSGQTNTRKISISLKETIQSFINEQIQKDRILFVFEERNNKIITDPDYLRIIISNLLDNALKYSPENSCVTIYLTQQKNTIKFKIENLPNEAGLPDASQVFNKYYRSAGAHKKIGAGLGLYIVKGLVTQLDMNIHYIIDENRVVFSIDIPLERK